MLTQQQIQVDTRGRGIFELTADVQSIVRQSGIKAGTCNVFIRHTSASLMICENADPAVLRATGYPPPVLEVPAPNVRVVPGPGVPPVHAGPSAHRDQVPPQVPTQLGLV